MHTLELLGGGKMGEALLGGLLRAGAVEPAEVVVVERVPERRAELAARHGVEVCDHPVAAESVIVATKPDDVPAALEALSGTGVRRVLSIAAGVSIASMEARLDPGVAVVRSMPNTPSLVGLGAAAIAGGASATDPDLDWAASVLGAVGTVVRVAEGDLDAVTAVSGSGPAYVFLVAEALIAAGVGAGLAPEVADALVRQTLLGAATLLVDSGEDPAALRAAVTSPGGTTQAALAVLARRDVPGAFADAVAAAAERSRELGS
jgi:pyrroline-5-carboxylate reductase